jgi:hypothetical protein
MIKGAFQLPYFFERFVIYLTKRMRIIKVSTPFYELFFMGKNLGVWPEFGRIQDQFPRISQNRFSDLSAVVALKK